MGSLREVFRHFAHAASQATGSAIAFLIAIVVVAAWAITGPLFNFSDTWQLVINTGTTIVTFLMVFLIQNTQNRDSQAIHAKLDELLYHNHETDNHLIDAEDLSDEELNQLKERYMKLAQTVGGGPTSRRANRKKAGNSNGSRKTDAKL